MNPVIAEALKTAYRETDDWIRLAKPSGRTIRAAICRQVKCLAFGIHTDNSRAVCQGALKRLKEAAGEKE